MQYLKNCYMWNNFEDFGGQNMTRLIAIYQRKILRI